MIGVVYQAPVITEGNLVLLAELDAELQAQAEVETVHAATIFVEDVIRCIVRFYSICFCLTEKTDSDIRTCIAENSKVLVYCILITHVYGNF